MHIDPRINYIIPSNQKQIHPNTFINVSNRPKSHKKTTQKSNYTRNLTLPLREISLVKDSANIV